MGLSDGTLIWKKFGRSLEEEKVEENKDFFPDYFKFFFDLGVRRMKID
jgi:hypothetical protein